MYPFFFSVYNLWLLSNYDKKTQETIKWIANAFILISAVAMSISLGIAASSTPFVGFLIAHLLWGFFAVISRDRPLLGMFIFLVPIDLYAIYIRL